MTDEHCFEWVYERKFIRDRHVVRNGQAPYAGETLYGWDPKEKRLAYWYWNSDGEMLVGAVEYRADSIVFPTRVHDRQGHRRDARDLGAHGAGQLPRRDEPARRRSVEAALGDGAQAETELIEPAALGYGP